MLLKGQNTSWTRHCTLYKCTWPACRAWKWFNSRKRRWLREPLSIYSTWNINLWHLLWNIPFSWLKRRFSIEEESHSSKGKGRRCWLGDGIVAIECCTIEILCPFAIYFVRYSVRQFSTISRIFLVSGTIKWRQRYIMLEFQHYVPLTSLYSPALWNARKILSTISSACSHCTLFTIYIYTYLHIYIYIYIYTYTYIFKKQ